MNAVANAHSTVQMLTLLKRISILPEPVFKYWDSKCLALIAQMFRPFGMNPKIGGLSPSQVQTFSISKLWHFHKNIRSCVEMSAVARAQWALLMLTLLKKAHYRFKLDFQNIDLHTGGKWFIHGTKHRETISCKAWKPPVEYPSRECKHDIKESEGNLFNQYSKGMSRGRNIQGVIHLQNKNYLITESLYV